MRASPDEGFSLSAGDRRVSKPHGSQHGISARRGPAMTGSNFRSRRPDFVTLPIASIATEPVLACSAGGGLRPGQKTLHVVRPARKRQRPKDIFAEAAQARQRVEAADSEQVGEALPSRTADMTRDQAPASTRPHQGVRPCRPPAAGPARPRSSPSAPGLGLSAPAATFRSHVGHDVVGVFAASCPGSSRVQKTCPTSS